MRPVGESVGSPLGATGPHHVSCGLVAPSGGCNLQWFLIIVIIVDQDLQAAIALKCVLYTRPPVASFQSLLTM